MADNEPIDTPKRKHDWVRTLGFAAIILMIVAMALPSTLQNKLGQTDRGGRMVGKLPDGSLVGSEDIEEAHNLIQSMSQVYVTLPDRSGGSQMVPLVEWLWGAGVMKKLDADREAAFILKEEAAREGPGVSPNQLDAAVKGEFTQSSAGGSTAVMGLRSRDGRLIAIESPEVSQAERQHYTRVVHTILSIQALFDAAGNIAKPSQRTAERSLAQYAQSLRMRAVAMDTAEKLSQVSEPTDDQLRAHLARFADNLPGRVNLEDNPFGFGYKTGNAVKLQALIIPRKLVREAVKAQKTDYRWSVEAGQYYQDNLSRFQTEASPQSTGLLIDAPKPTTRPFDEVKDKAIQTVIDIATQERMKAIELSVRSTMDMDYRNYHVAVGLKSATQPSSMGAIYSDAAYLDAVAASIQKKFGVLPTVARYEERFRTERELAELPVLGRAQGIIREPTVQGPMPRLTSFEEYATEKAADVLTKAQQKKLGEVVLERLEPAEVLESISERDVCFFRITEANAAQAPTIEQVDRGALTADWKKSQAYALTMTEAGTLAQAARNGGIASATTRPVIETRTFGYPQKPEDRVPAGFLSANASSMATEQFLSEAYIALLSPAAEKGAVVFGVPLADRVVVAERQSVEPAWQTPADRQALAAQSFTELWVDLSPANSRSGVFSEPINEAWFSPEQIRIRSGYVPSNPSTQDDL